MLTKPYYNPSAFSPEKLKELETLLDTGPGNWVKEPAGPRKWYKGKDLKHTNIREAIDIIRSVIPDTILHDMYAIRFMHFETHFPWMLHNDGEKDDGKGVQFLIPFSIDCEDQNTKSTKFFVFEQVMKHELSTGQAYRFKHDGDSLRNEDHDKFYPVVTDYATTLEPWNGYHDFDKGLYERYLNHNPFTVFSGLTIQDIFDWFPGMILGIRCHQLHVPSNWKKERITKKKAVMITFVPREQFQKYHMEEITYAD